MGNSNIGKGKNDANIQNCKSTFHAIIRIKQGILFQE